MSMSVSIIDLYSAESWSISNALCVLSGNDEIDSSSAIVWNCCCWASRHGGCPVASSRLSNPQQRRLNNRKCWAGNVVWSADVEWLTINDVGWECLRLAYNSRPGTWEPCIADSDALWLPVCSGCVLGRRAGAIPHVELVCASDETRCSVQYTLQLVSNVSWWFGENSVTIVHTQHDKGNDKLLMESVSRDRLIDNELLSLMVEQLQWYAM